MMVKWSPRGEQTYPDWKKAEPGQRVQHVRTLATGTVVGVHPSFLHITIDWDDIGFGVSRGRVVSPAYDLKPI